MRILLIGGNGFIGSPLAQELQGSGHEIAVFHRGLGRSSITPEVHQIHGDRNRLSEYQNQFKQFSPDIIVDLILSTGEQARQLVKISHNLASRSIVLSSMDVYRAWGVLHRIEPGPPDPLPLTEDSQLRTTRQIYSPEMMQNMRNIFTWVDEHYDKIAVEEAFLNAPGPGTVLRLPMIYGPGDPLHRFFPLLKRIHDGRSSIILSDDFAAWRCPRGYVENVAHAIAIVATSDGVAGRIYNYCDEPTVSELEWQTRIAKQMKWAGKFYVLPNERTPKHLLQSGNLAQHVVASSDRIRTELGYGERIEIGDAIEKTAAWELRQPASAFDSQLFDYVAEDEALENAA